MLRTGQLRRAPPRPRDLARRRGPRYRGPWRLPGPDSHRLAAVSLSLGYLVGLLLSGLLCARAPPRLAAVILSLVSLVVPLFPVLLGARATGSTFRRNPVPTPSNTG